MYRADVLAANAVVVRIGANAILQSVSLEIPAGSVTGLLGPSGAGKTTLFRVLVGEIAPSSGDVTLDGSDITALPLWRRARAGLGYVPQGGGILPDLTIAENLRTFEEAARQTRRPAADRAREVGLEHRLNVRARELSGGEQRRLALLRALVADPRFLIVDEPFAGVDPGAAEALVRVFQRRARSGCGILLADHRAREALAASDSVALLVDGQVKLRLPSDEFARHPTVKARYMV